MPVSATFCHLLALLCLVSGLISDFARFQELAPSAAPKSKIFATYRELLICVVLSFDYHSSDS